MNNKRLFAGSRTAAALLLILIALLSFAAAGHAQGEDIPCTENALRAAIEAATLDEITLPDECRITLTIDLPSVTKAFVINGNGAVIDGSGEHRAFRVGAGGELTVSSLTLQNGSGRLGGALYVEDGTAILDAVIFRSNAAFAGYGGGAVLVSGGMVTIASSVFADNTSVQTGGAVAVFGGAVDITNSTFSGNGAISGGALAILGGQVTLTSSTLADNRAERGGGLYQAYAGTVTVSQSIIAGNNADANDDVYQVGGLASDGYNLFSDTEFGTNMTFAASDIFTPVPGIGGFTGTAHGLLVSSAALDAVPAAVCAAEADQRGTERPQGENCDIGAVEMVLSDQRVTVNEVERLDVIALEMPGEGECSLRASADLFSLEVPADTYCRVLMRNGGWVNNPGSVPQAVIDRGVIVAVEVFSLREGQALDSFAGVLPICLRGEGRVVFLDAAQSPRTESVLPGVIDNGRTCAFVHAPGTVALVQR